MIHLRSVTVRQRQTRPNATFPFNLPVVQAFSELTFSAPVTFFVGENGSGKSTVLEALACAISSITVGSESVKTDPSLTAVRTLADQLKLSWQKRTHKGFFMRAEDFFGYTRRLSQMQQDFVADLENVDREYDGRSQTAVNLAKMPYINELHALKQRYGDGLDAHSHGESFLTLFQSRFVPDGLYLLDEPEAPLSPIRQLAFLATLKDMVGQNAQFVIATHSPIIMAFPNAVIFDFDAAPLQQIKYEDVEHVQLMKSFLNNPETFLQHL